MYNEKISLFLFRPRNKSNNFLFPNTDILIPNIIPRDLTPISIICIEKITETNNSYWLWRPSWKILKNICLQIHLSGKQVKSGFDMSEPLKKHSHCSPMAMGTHTFQIFQPNCTENWRPEASGFRSLSWASEAELQNAHDLLLQQGMNYQSCRIRVVHGSLFLDPANRWPDPTRRAIADKKSDPTRGLTLPPYIHSLIE